MIDTKRVRERRVMRFEVVGDVLRDAEELAEAARAEELRAVGNWTLGQAFGHLAYWARLPFEGYPEMPRLPWVARVLRPVVKRHVLRKGLSAGVQLPGVAGGTYGVEPCDVDEGLRELREAFTRLELEGTTIENPFFGRMTREELIQLNLRHAELHLGFFHVQ